MKALNYGIPCLLLLAACSPGDPVSNPQPSASATAGPEVVNECTSYVDRTAANADREITWDLGVAAQAERCMKIKVGQTVTFRGDFTMHPLKGQNGDFSDVFATVDRQVLNRGAAGQENAPIPFPAAGTFGFTCSVHNPMMGAIQVVP